jgi:hypothetical protein
MVYWCVFVWHFLFNKIWNVLGFEGVFVLFWHAITNRSRKTSALFVFVVFSSTVKSRSMIWTLSTTVHNEIYSLVCNQFDVKNIMHWYVAGV